MRTLKRSSPSVQTKIFNACVHKEYSLDWKGLILLNEEGISTTHLPARLRSVEVLALNVVYCGIGIIGGAYGLNLWHPEWVIFFAIPLYSVLSGILDRRP